MAQRTLDFEVRSDGLDDNDVSFSTVVPSFEVSLGVNSANNNIAVLTETVELDTKINVIDVKLNSTSVSAEEELEFSMYDFIRGKDGQDGKDGKDGRDGRNGTNGQNGRTPVKGVDYWTESDKLEIVNDVVQDPVFKQNYYDKSQIDIKLSNKANAAQAVPTGGTTGQVLAKHSGNDNDVEWIDLQTAVSITYSELKTLRDEGSLITGTLYRITDYHTTVSPLITDVRSADHQFDIIVRADDERHLNENAYAAHHEGDTYFADCKLEAWELRYSLDNEKWSRIAGIFIEDDVDGYHMRKLGNVEVDGEPYILWDASEYTEDYEITRAVSEDDEVGTELKAYDPETGEILDEGWSAFIASKVDVEGDGKGTILMLKDEYGNQCPYDFKNIQFKRWIVTDSHQGRNGLEGKYMGFLYSNSANVLIEDYNDFIWAYTFSSDATGNEDQVDYSLDGTHWVYGNVLATAPDAWDDLNNIVLYGEYNYNNRFGLNCYVNSLDNNCQNNSFGNFCTGNTFGSGCNNNSFEGCCYNNSFGRGCTYNSFGIDCQNNSFGNWCTNNTFGSGCNNNTFGSNCYVNSFENGCTYNSFGNNCQYNSFENNCRYNSFGNYCQTITVFDGVQYCSVTGGSSSSPVKNAQILNGTKGTSSSNKLTIAFTANKNYTQIAAKNANGTLKIWSAADKQDTLVSGTNIKTINNQSLLGSGNVTISSGSSITFRQW